MLKQQINFHIQEGEIYATINQKDGMVRFLEDLEQYNHCAMIERIDSSIQRLMTISNKLTTMNEMMSCDPAYLGKTTTTELTMKVVKVHRALVGPVTFFRRLIQNAESAHLNR